MGGGSSEREEIGRKMHNANFCHVSSAKILLKPEPKMFFDLD